MKIEYRTDGVQGAPLLVLANSLGTTFDMWQPQMTALTRHYNVLRYNQRGHGRTPLPAGELSMDVLAQDVIALLDHLNVDKADFCGISMGGLTGLWLARYHPTRFRKMVVANTAARIGEAGNWHQRAQQVRKAGLSEVAAGSSTRWFTSNYIREHHPQVSRMVMQLSHASPQGYAACCDVLANTDLHAELAHIGLPLLAIAGDADAITTVADAETLRQSVPQAQLAVLHASHLSNITCPQAFNDAVLDFLQQ